MVVLVRSTCVSFNDRSRNPHGYETHSGDILMKSLMQQALGDDWHKLPPALQAHYRTGKMTETGSLDIYFPPLMQPYLSFLRLFGTLLNRRGKNVTTLVEKYDQGRRQYWKRTVTYPDGKVMFFKSYLESAGGNRLTEFVNPVLGLKTSVKVVNEQLHYEGVSLIVNLGILTLPIPEWLVLGHTLIVEEAIDENHFQMDFRLTHPWFGELFRYAGKFEV